MKEDIPPYCEPPFTFHFLPNTGSKRSFYIVNQIINILNPDR